MKPSRVEAASKSNMNPIHPTMESLALPRELYWDGKTEPISPSSSELFAIASELTTDNWLHDDNFANEILYLTNGTLELKSGTDILHELINAEDLVVELCDLKEENWSTQPLSSTVSHLTAYSGLETIIATQPSPLIKIEGPYNIKYDANNIYEPAGTLTTLTPPQSPPRNGSNAAASAFQPETILHQHYQHSGTTTSIGNNTSACYTILEATTANPASSATSTNNYFNAIDEEDENATGNIVINTAAADNDQLAQTQIVDQIIEEFAKDLPDCGMSDEYESQYTFSPPSQIEENSTDEEWMPSSGSASSSPMRYNNSGSCSSSSSSISGDEQSCVTITNLDVAGNSSSTTTKKRTRPYGRGVEDRKIRKKEQNKNAATRYRQKKKLEMEVVLNEELILAERNQELRSKLADHVREMKYLKGLIREFYGNEKGKRA